MFWHFKFLIIFLEYFLGATKLFKKETRARLGQGPSRRRLPRRTREESGPNTARRSVSFFCKLFRIEKQIKEILNGLQKSRNKFSRASKIKPHKVNIYLGPKCNFEKHTFFLNSNKIASKTKIKYYFIFY